YHAHGFGSIVNCGGPNPDYVGCNKPVAETPHYATMPPFTFFVADIRTEQRCPKHTGRRIPIRKMQRGSPRL
ncbi:MAG: hypothetical protein ACM3Q0_04930, partial [Bacteroidota bacterium]